MKIKYNILALLAMAFGLSSCVDDLNTVPIDPDIETSETVYGSPESYLEGLAKVYGAFVVQGQNGGNGTEIEGVDGGLSTFARGYWNCQELPADHAICAWGDNYVTEMNNMSWTTVENGNIKATYYRIMFTVTIANEYLKQTTTEKLDIRGTSDELRADIQGYRAEVRALRALIWSYGLDLFGNMPFVTEADPIGYFLPEQISRADLFNYVESELLALSSDPNLAAPKTNEYGRVDQGLMWGLLSRLYLNAEVYTGTPRYQDAMTWSEKVISAGVYDLSPSYAELFMGDNTTNASAAIEIIHFGQSNYEFTQNYAGAGYLVAASRRSSDLSNVPSGASTDAWGGIRTQPNLVELFEDNDQIDAVTGYIDTPDSRGASIFAGLSDYTYDGSDPADNRRNLENVSPQEFMDGYSVYKWKAISSDGTLTSAGAFINTSWIFMRLGEMYLNYAEAALRSGTNLATATDYINELRDRAYGNASGDIATADLDLDFMIDERGRELFWEGFRRTDLIRFGRFTSGTYNWPWKGGVAEGSVVNSRYALYPIPSTDMTANTNLIQNPGYGN